MGIIGNWIAGGKVPELTVDEVATRLGQAGFHVFDNNGPGAFEKAHVPQARRLDSRSFTVEDLPADKQATLVFYCSGPS